MKTQDTACEHCGTPFQPTAQESRFCCAGCSFVHEMITGSGLAQFYDLKGSAPILPAGNAVLLQSDAAWAADAQRDAEAAGARELVEGKFDVQGVSCVGCVWLIEAAFLREPGSARCVVDPTRGSATLTWCRGAFDLPAFVRKIGSFGYKLAPESHTEAAPGASGLRLGLCGALAMNAMAFTLPRYAGMDPGFALADVFELVAAFSATVSLLVGGGYFIQRAWAALRLGRLHLDVPIAIGIVAAWLGSLAGWFLRSPDLLYFDFVAVFIFLMMLGRRMQEVSVARNRHRLLRNDPSLQQVEIEIDGQRQRRPAADLLVKHTFHVSPGGVVPVAAQLLAPQATLSLDWITGEAAPVHYTEGAVVPAGAVHLGQSPLALQACEAWADSLLARLVQTETNSAQSDPAARWLDRTLRIYLAVILVAAVTGSGFWLAHGAGWARALQIFVSVLVVSCPCALGVAVPLAHDLAVSRLREFGLFVRTADFWGRLLRVRKIVFDKTGTLTLDTPRLLDAGPLESLSPEASGVLAALVSESRHPVSSALREALAGCGLFHPAASVRAEEISGHGLRFTDDQGRQWELRRPTDREAGLHGGENEEAGPSGDTLFTCDGVVLAGFRFSEQVRSDARDEIAHFQQAGLGIYLLSGDRESKVSTMAAALGVRADQSLARQTPEEKGAWMQAFGHDALFIGDGANDTLAAQAALCSGTLAVERTLLAEQSDFYFLSRSLSPLRLLFEVARSRRTAVLRAFTLALTYNLGVLALALAGKMNPLLAAILMPLSSLATILIVSLTLRAKRTATRERGRRSAHSGENGIETMDGLHPATVK